jgi:hypothetical protein
VEVFYVDQDRISGFHIPAGLRVHGGNSRKQAKKALRLYFRGEYGKPRLEYPLFPQSEVQSFKRLILHAGGSEYPYANTNGTLLRNPLMTSLSAQNNGLATYDRPALLFINGHLWGIYYVREYMNRHYWHDHYGEEFFGGYGEPWFKFFDFVRTHDLRDPDHYAYVQTQIDIENFIDYNILEFYGANFEWPHFNQFRYRPRSQGGRWHWVFWDEDLVFGMSPVVSVDYNMVKRILFDDDGEIATSALLLRKLMENPHFYALFLSRMVDLLNTSLAPEQVIAHIDALAVELESDIHYETRRWPSSSRWQTSVEGLRQFARLRPDILRQHFSDGFGLEGIVQLTIGQPTGNAGTVAVNDNLVDELPWQGVYYQGMAVRVTAVAGSGYRFSGWDSPDLPHSPVISLTLNMTRTITPVFTSARLEDLQPGDVIINRYGIDEVGEIEGDWIELVVNRPGGIDLRGWRLTDNDTKTATDEGSLIFGRNPALSTVRQGKRILIVATETASNDQRFPHDYLDSLNREIVLYVGNDNLDTDRDPWFNLGPNDNVALLAPGLTDAFHDDQGIAFVNVGRATSPSNITTPGFFGILQDGVTGGE